MPKYFNVEGACDANEHYMVCLDERLQQIKKMVDAGKYFAINKGRQYGKTTMLLALSQYLKGDYDVLELDFQLLSQEDFINERAFVSAFAREVLVASSNLDSVPLEIKTRLEDFANHKEEDIRLALLFSALSKWCKEAVKPIILTIDEVDSASNNQVFLDFLSQLRGYYIHRKKRPTFQSVIFAGVYDIKNLKTKIRPDEEHKINRPWNIAADFDVRMDFTVEDICGMLKEYEEDNQTGMDIVNIAELLYAYTSGYPFLVCRLCRIMDETLVGSEQYPEKSDAWTKQGMLQAVKLLLTEQNTLFDNMKKKLIDYPNLCNMLQEILYNGRKIPYNVDSSEIDLAMRFGFIKNERDVVTIANRIFETRLYNYFATEEGLKNELSTEGSRCRKQFVENGCLNMKNVLERFVVHFNELYGDSDVKFQEKVGRKYFLFYLKPIINGIGNYYIEAQTRDEKRTDVIVDYNGEQHVVELKIWHGEEYNSRGEQQLLDYLEAYHVDKGYMLSFNFNKSKKIGVKEVCIGNKVLVEAVV